MPTLAEQIAPQRKQPEGLGGWLSSIADEAMGAFERYGRRSGAQRDASLALLNQASAPGTDPIMGAGQKMLGLAGLITHPLAFFPTGDEWRERLSNAGNNGRMGQAIGGMLGDLPSIVDPHLLAGGGALAAAPLLGKMVNKADDVGDIGIIAYHGSPHSFDKFDMSKIGTGEGAQAYGHGLYFAEAEGVADDYRKTLGGKGLDVRKVVEKHYPDAPLSEEATAAIYSAATNGKPDPKDAAKSVQMRVAALRDTGQSFMDGPGEKGQKLAAAISDIREIQRGSMYQVKINVKPDELLDWDKPLSEQPESIRKAVQSAVVSRYNNGVPDKGGIVRKNFDAIKNGTFDGIDGSIALKQAGDIVNQPEAAARLKAAGVKGIRYKDSASRGTEGGTYNYVIFDDKLITILKKYGIPMTAGVGGAMMVAGQDMPPEIAVQMGGT